MRMTVEDGDDAQTLLLGGGEVIIDIALWIDDGGFTVGPEKIGSVRETLDKKTLQIHGVNWWLRFR